MGEAFTLEPDLMIPHRYYIYDMRDGQKIIALFHNLIFAKEYLNWLNQQEEFNRTNW